MGRKAARSRTRPRRTQRCRKVCAFQVKKATGFTVVRSRRLPSTRQCTRGTGWPELWVGCCKVLTNPEALKCYTGPPGGKAQTFLLDRKSTRLNSSHANISYAVFC